MAPLCPDSISLCLQGSGRVKRNERAYFERVIPMLNLNAVLIYSQVPTMCMSYEPCAGWTPVSDSDQMCTGGYGRPTLMVRHDPMDYGNLTRRTEAMYHNPPGYSTPTHNTFLTPLDSHHNKASEALGVNDIPLEHLHRHIPDTGSQLLPPIMESQHLSRSIDSSPSERRSIPPTPAIEDFISREEILYPTISRHTPNSNVSNISEIGKVVGNVSESRVRIWNVND